MQACTVFRCGPPDENENGEGAIATDAGILTASAINVTACYGGKSAAFRVEGGAKFSVSDTIVIACGPWTCQPGIDAASSVSLSFNRTQFVKNQGSEAVIKVASGQVVVTECIFANPGLLPFKVTGTLDVSNSIFSESVTGITETNNNLVDANVTVEAPEPSVTPECPARPQPSLAFSLSEQFSKTPARFAETGKFSGSTALNSQAVFLDTPLSFQSPDFVETGTGQQSAFLKASDGCPESLNVEETNMIGETGSIEASSSLGASQVICESANGAMGESAFLEGTNRIRETLVIVRSFRLGETV
jgi:hypothetical protein